MDASVSRPEDFEKVIRNHLKGYKNFALSHLIDSKKYFDTDIMYFIQILNLFSKINYQNKIDVEQVFKMTKYMFYKYEMFKLINEPSKYSEKLNNILIYLFAVVGNFN